MLPQGADLEKYRSQIQNSKEEQNEMVEKESYDKINFIYDFKKGDFVVKDGKLLQVEGKEGIKVWIEKNLRTTIHTYKMYEDFEDREFGVGIKPLILGRKLPSFFREAELEREIRESLQEHPMIKTIDNFTLETDRATLHITFRVVLVNGEDFDFMIDFNEYTGR